MQLTFEETIKTPSILKLKFYFNRPIYNFAFKELKKVTTDLNEMLL